MTTGDTVLCSDDGTKVVCRTNTAVYYSSDGGASWKEVVKSE